MGSDPPPLDGRLALQKFKFGGPQEQLAAVATSKDTNAKAGLTLVGAGIASRQYDPDKLARGRLLLLRFRAQKLNEQNAANGAATGAPTPRKHYGAATGSTDEQNTAN